MHFLVAQIFKIKFEGLLVEQMATRGRKREGEREYVGRGRIE